MISRACFRATEEVIVREMRYLRRDGTPFWVRTSASIARAPGTATVGIVVRAIEDIDTRQKAETALSAAKQELEQVVEERTAALSQRNLLLREVYHRVKNNLQLIDSLLMMQDRKIADPQAKEALQSLRSRISALGLVHEQLMGSADLKTFDVVPFLDDLSNNLMESGGNNGVDICRRGLPAGRWGGLWRPPGSAGDRVGDQLPQARLPQRPRNDIDNTSERFRRLSDLDRVR